MLKLYLFQLFSSLKINSQNFSPSCIFLGHDSYCTKLWKKMQIGRLFLLLIPYIIRGKKFSKKSSFLSFYSSSLSKSSAISSCDFKIFLTRFLYTVMFFLNKAASFSVLLASTRAS